MESNMAKVDILISTEGKNKENGEEVNEL